MPVHFGVLRLKQGVSLTGGNRTGPPCSVGAHAPARRQRYRWRQTTNDDRRQPAKQYWPIRWASNKQEVVLVSVVI